MPLKQRNQTILSHYPFSPSIVDISGNGHNPATLAYDVFVKDLNLEL